MRSRWTEFLTTDGEKPNRNRDTEFVDPPSDRKSLMQAWEDGWERVLGSRGWKRRSITMALAFEPEAVA